MTEICKSFQHPPKQHFLAPAYFVRLYPTSASQCFFFGHHTRFPAFFLPFRSIYFITPQRNRRGLSYSAISSQQCCGKSFILLTVSFLPWCCFPTCWDWICSRWLTPPQSQSQVVSQVAEQSSPSFPCTHLSCLEECSLLHKAWELLTHFLKLYNCESLLKVTPPSCNFRVKSSSGVRAPSPPAHTEMKGTMLSFKYLKLWSFWYFPRFLSGAFSAAFVPYCSVGNWTPRYNMQHLQCALQNWVLSRVSLGCLHLIYLSSSLSFSSSELQPLCVEEEYYYPHLPWDSEVAVHTMSWRES